MHQMRTHSRNSLFLAELILALLFLALVCAGCIRLFASAYLDRTEARRLNYIREYTISTGELLEGWNGQEEELSRLFPDSVQEDDRLVIRYDHSWNVSSDPDSPYLLSIFPEVTADTKGAVLSFSDSEGVEYYAFYICYPLLAGDGKEADGNEE